MCSSDLLKIEFSKKFDLVFSHAVVDHVYDMDSFILKIINLSKKYSYITAYRGFFPELKKHKINWNNEDGSYYNDLSIPQIKKIFKENGIDENEIKIRSLKIDNQNNNPLTKYFIFDDCMSSQDDWIKDEHFVELLCKGSHYNIPMIFIQQFAHGFTQYMYDNFDYVFLFREDHSDSKKRLYNIYGNKFKNYKDFKKTLYDLTKNYSCMVIDNRENKIKQFRAKV